MSTLTQCINIRIIIHSIIMSERKNLQKTKIGVPYVYLEKKVIEAYGWLKGQLIDINYDVQHKRIIITEAEAPVHDFT